MLDKYSLWSDTAQFCGASANLDIPELGSLPSLNSHAQPN
jgi:hypothetical protein